MAASVKIASSNILSDVFRDYYSAVFLGKIRISGKIPKCFGIVLINYKCALCKFIILLFIKYY
jgi:hypothetical protein